MRELMIQLAKLDVPTLKTTLIKILKEYYRPNKVYISTNSIGFIAAEGDIPICLIAHIDTVFDRLPKHFFYDQKQSVLWSPEGLGADDRAGVAIILDVIRSGKRPHIIFTDGEERGGKGALDLITTFPNYKHLFSNLNFIVELDRHGKDECVFYDCDNPQFTTFIESFGFKTQQGTFTDISIICPTWGIAGVNLSVGYFKEHSLGEHLNVKFFNDTRKKLDKILHNHSKRYEYIRRKYYDTYGDYEDYYTIKCSDCDTLVSFWEIIECEGENPKDDLMLCPQCFSKRKDLQPCMSCQDWIVTTNSNKTICRTCKQKGALKK